MVFAEYARYYDMFYQDKPYAEEAQYVANLIRERVPQAVRLLNLGCGTGRHDHELARLGFDVTGVDQSDAMIALARGRVAKGTSRIVYECGDMRNWQGGVFDAVVSLFHVMSYQISDQDVSASLQTIAKALDPGGICVFDFWFGPGVVADPPVVRTREVSGDGWLVSRLSTPDHRPESELVSVRFDIDLKGPDSQELQFSEVHDMRYFFGPELDRMAGESGFEVLEMVRWMSRTSPTDRDWNAAMVLRKM